MFTHLQKIGLIGFDGKICTSIRNIQTVYNKEYNITNCCEFVNALTDDNNEVVIDFSRPTATMKYLKQSNSKCPLIIGTTGYNVDQMEEIKNCAKSRIILMANNFSLGIYRLNKYLATMGKDLKSWDCEIVEEHHNQKIDSPSGTAITLGESVANAQNLDLKYLKTEGERYKSNNKREKGEIGFSSIRCGAIFGKHTAIFDNGIERIEISHTAHSTELFAHGASIIAEKVVFDKGELERLGKILTLDDIKSLNF